MNNETSIDQLKGNSCIICLSRSFAFSLILKVRNEELLSGTIWIQNKLGNYHPFAMCFDNEALRRFDLRRASLLLEQKKALFE